MALSKEELQEISEKPFIVSHREKDEKKVAIAEIKEGFITTENFPLHQWLGCPPHWLLKKPHWYRTEDLI